FIKDVALDWDETKILEAEIGDYLTIARKTKGKEEWFIGGITDENARTSSITLDFLKANVQYEATIYSDAPDAHWQQNPKAYQIKKETVGSTSTLNLQLAPGGGYAIHIKPSAK
ncbi:MAG: glycoside hydrolase family 97 C-terminal domain-containing protein, partial [Chloroherpetonaceae bacterium]